MTMPPRTELLATCKSLPYQGRDGGRLLSRMGRRRAAGPPSPLADALARVGDRWTLLVVASLMDGAKRFNELQDDLDGIAPNVLSGRLKHLTEQAVVVSLPLLGAPAALRLRAHRGRPRAGRRPAPARRLGRSLGGGDRAAAPRGVRNPARGPLVVPGLRGDRRGRRRSGRRRRRRHGVGHRPRHPANRPRTRRGSRRGRRLRRFRTARSPAAPRTAGPAPTPRRRRPSGCSRRSRARSGSSS